MTPLTVRGPDRGLNERKFLLITHSQIQGIPELSRTFVEVKAGSVVHRTKIFKDKTDSPWWDEEILLHLNDRESSAVKFSLSLYHGRSWLWKQFLGRVEVPLHEILAGNSGECLIQIKIKSPAVTAESTSTVLLRYRTDLYSAARGLVEDTAQPTEHTNPLLNAVSTVQPLAGVVQETLNKTIPILETIEPLKQLLDEIAKFHPFATAAWSLLSVGYNILKAQQSKDESVCSLYNSMMETYQTATQDDILRKHSVFQDIFDAMLGQTMECAIFIKEYLTKKYIERLLTLDVSDKVEQFKASFDDLGRRFTGDLTRTMAVVAFSTYSSVKFIEMDLILSRLNPHRTITRRDPCLPGTRTREIVAVVSWIAKQSNEIFWLRGLAGTGKSALASTIAEHCRAMGDHGRLGAFIRFDRNQMNDPFRVIPTLAYKLASFDDRLGILIADVIKKVPDIVDRSLQEQFTRLVRGPLSIVEDLADEGPVVILMDGLDECGTPGRRKELLALLARGFGDNLPFIRLIITSRPEPDIEGNLSPKYASSTIIQDLTLRPLDPSIRFYFKAKFGEIEDPHFQELLQRRSGIYKLETRAQGLFIWASTVYEFIKESPSDRLKVVLEQSVAAASDAEASLDFMYRTVLQLAVPISGRNDDIKSDLRLLLGLLVTAPWGVSLTCADVDQIVFDPNNPKCRTLLDRLASVTSYGDSRPIRFLHKSFYDFLGDECRCGIDWFFGPSVSHQLKVLVLKRCPDLFMRYMDSCDFPPTARNPLFGDRTAIPAFAAYADYQWRKNLCVLDHILQEGDQKIRAFLGTDFFRWLVFQAAMNCIDRVHDSLEKLIQLTNTSTCTEADRNMRYDAFEFVAQLLFFPTSSSPFTTALVFAPPENSICKRYSVPNTPRVTTIPDGRLRCHCFHSSKGVNSVSISSDGSKFASASKDAIIRLWDSKMGAPLLELRGHSRSVNCVTFARNGSKIASGSDDRTLQLWDAEVGTHLSTFSGHSLEVMSVAFSPDSKKLVSGSLDATVRVWSVSTGILLILRGHRSSVNSVAFSPNGSQVVSGSTDETIRIWDATSGAKVIQITPALMNPSPSATPHTNFSSGLSGYGIGLWDPFSGSLLLPPTSTTLPNEYRQFGSVMFSPDGSQILSGSPRPQLFTYTHPVNHSVQFSHDGSKIVSVRGDAIFVWETATSTPLARISCHSTVLSATFSPDSSQVIAGCENGTVSVWDVLLVRSPSIPARFSTCLAMSSDRSRVALGNQEGARIWDVSTGASIPSPRGGKQPQAVALSSDGSKIASGQLDGTIQLWDVWCEMPILNSRRGHNGAISALAFCSDGTKIASAAKDMMIRVWDASSGIMTLDITLHGLEHSYRHCALAIAFSSDASKIASVLEDASIQIWDALTGAPLLAPLARLRHRTVALAFSPRDSKIVSVCSKGTVLVSHLASSPPQSEQCITHSDQRDKSVEAPGKVVEYPLQLEESDDFAVRFPQEFRTGVNNPFTAMTSPNGVAIVTIDKDDQLVVVDIPLEVAVKKKRGVPVGIR